jgi:hypothetical protein
MRHDIAVACLLAFALLGAGCSKPKAPVAPPGSAAAGTAANTETIDSKDFFDPKKNPGYATAAFVDPKKLSASQLKYGIAPKRDSRITYTDDVILMEDGDKAIKVAGSDGITWSFDANAAHVSEFQEGKIVFATSRAVGRIARMAKTGDVVTVNLLPVQITEVIHDGKLLGEGDIDASTMITYVAPDFPSVADRSPDVKPAMWNEYQDDWRELRPRFIRTALSMPPGGPPPLQPPAIPQPGGLLGPPPLVTLDDDFKSQPIASAQGSVGMEYWYTKKNLNINAWGVLRLQSAHVKFKLNIVGMHIQEAGIELSGAVELKVHLQANSTTELFVNAHQTVNLPVDMSLPIPIAGVPLALTFHESFSLDTAFSAKQSILKGDGDYTFGGTVFAGLRDGHAVLDKPTFSKAVTDIGQSIGGISVGINSMVIGFSVRAMVGIGAFGFNTGVYAGVDFTGTVLKQSDIVMSACKMGGMNAMIDSGVGYSLSAPIMKAVNIFVKWLTGKEIPTHGTLWPGPSGWLFQLTTEIPTGCATPKGTAT